MAQKEGDTLTSAIMGRPVEGESLAGLPIQGSAIAPAEGHTWDTDAPADQHAFLTTALTGTNNDLTFTSKALGGEQISIEYLDPGADGSIAGTVTGDAISVTLAYATGAITSTAGDVKTALDGDTGASALITTANAAGNDGSGLVTAMTKTNLAVAEYS